VLAGLGFTGVVAVIESARASRRRPREHRGASWRTTVLMATAITLDVALLQWAGFVIASAILFWFTARAFDTRHPWRDAVFATGVSVASYLLFVRVLQLSLPAGLLSGWL
jgi:putative tricarboxylic transport membrane protein